MSLEHGYMLEVRICVQCKEEYDGYTMNHSIKYCSDKCRKLARSHVNLQNKNLRKKRFEIGDIDFIVNDIFTKYKKRSPHRGLEFTLTLDFFLKHYRANCYYCGEIINFVGFDRVNNSIGYTIENSVPCCTDCNLMKRSLSFEVFIKKCKQIATKHP